MIKPFNYNINNKLCYCRDFSLNLIKNIKTYISLNQLCSNYTINK